MRDSVTRWVRGYFSDFCNQIENKSKLVIIVLAVTFILSVVGLILALVTYFNQDMTQFIMIPKHQVLKFNNQEYVPLTILI